MAEYEFYSVIEQLANRGVECDKIKGLFYANLNIEKQYADVFVAFDGSAVYVIDGNFSCSIIQRVKGYIKKYSEVFTVNSFTEYKISKGDELSVEKLYSYAKMYITSGNSKQCVATFNFSCLENSQQFTLAVNKSLSGEIGEFKAVKKVGIADGVFEGRLLGKLLPYVYEQRFSSSLLIICSFVVALLSSIIPYILGVSLFDNLLSNKGELYNNIYKFISILVGLKIALILLSWLQTITACKISKRATLKMRNCGLKNLQKQECSFFVDDKMAYYAKNFIKDTNTVDWLMVNGFSGAIQQFSTMAIVGVCMFLLNPILALVLLVGLPLLLLVCFPLIRLFGNIFAKSNYKRKTRRPIISDERFKCAIQNRRASIGSDSNAIVKFDNILNPYITFLIAVGAFAIWIIGAIQMFYNETTIGVLITFSGFLVLFYQPFNFFIKLIVKWKKGVNSVRRSFYIIDQPAVSEQNKLDIDGEITDISINATLGGQPFKFDFKNKSTALIKNSSGSIRYEILQLIMSFKQVREGEVIINGTDGTKLSPKCICSKVSIVSPQQYFTNGTLLENLRIAKPSARLDEIIRLAKFFDLHNFIMEFDEAYETDMQEMSKSLNAQIIFKISLLRMLLKNPDIIIIDEMNVELDKRINMLLRKLVCISSSRKCTIIFSNKNYDIKYIDSVIDMCAAHTEEVA